MQQPFLLREDESRHKQLYNVFGMPVYLKTGGSDTDGQFSMFTAGHTKNQGPPLHCNNIDETFTSLPVSSCFRSATNVIPL